MSTNYNLTSDEIKTGISHCHKKVNSLLDTAEAIINYDHGSISSGLYSFAAEELGKLLLLKKELKKTPTLGKITVPPEIFGDSKKRSHPTIKFDEFLNELTIPEKCKKIRIVIGAVFPKRYTKVGDILISTPSAGGGAIYENKIIDFQLRKKIFYVDWKDGEWVRQQDIETVDLIDAIKELKKWMAENIPLS